MKKTIYLLGLAFLFSVALMAQSNNAILFTENGEKFQVVLNGVLQNQNPETNVKMTNLNADHYKCRIVFAETKLGYVDFNMFFSEMGYEATWTIKQNNKGQYVTRPVSAVPLAQAPQSAPSQTVVAYTATPPLVEAGSTTTTTSHSQTTTNNGNNNGDNINFNMGVNSNGEGGSISINASGMGMDDPAMAASSSSSTTTTTTYSSTTTTSGGGGGTVVNTNPPPAQVVYVPGYNGKIGCPAPMNPGEFSEAKETIRSKDFESTKLTIAKQILQNNCLTAQQVKELLPLFDFENTKLEFAKYAYDHTYDLGNYYKVNDAFEFESSVTDLNNYISARR